MKFTTSTAFALLATAFSAAPALAQPAGPFPTILNYDKRYDVASGTLASTACPLPGHPTFGSIPNFPHIAGSAFLGGFNSTQCGACWDFSYVHRDGTVKTLSFTIINEASGGFVSSLSGLEELTGLAENEIPGDVRITAQQVPVTKCGF